MTDETEATSAADNTEGEVAKTAEDVLFDKDATEGQEQTAEGADQTAEGEKEGATEEKAKDDEPKGAPESYEDFTMPEGVELDPELTDELKAAAKELNLNQADAQKLADLGAKQAQKLADAVAVQQQAVVDGWTEAAKTDKEFGGDKLAENLAVAKKGLEAYGSQALRDLLNETGLGNHPEVIRFALTVGKLVKEDAVVTGRESTSAPDTGAVLYDNPTSKNR